MIFLIRPRNCGVSIGTIGILILSIITLCRCSSKESPEVSVSASIPEISSSKESSVAADIFAKKQGLIGDNFPDQIAIESSHDPVEHRVRPNGRPFPLPVPMKGFTGSVVLPMPPGFHPSSSGGLIRLPGPGQHVGPHGSHSSPHPQFIPHSGEVKIHKSKEIYSGVPPPVIGQSVSQLHHHNHVTHQQIHDNVKQQIQQQILSSHSSEIHPHHKPKIQPGSTYPKIMVPPGPPLHFSPITDAIPPFVPIRDTLPPFSPIRDTHPPKSPHGYVGQDAQLANSVFRELFDRQQQKLKHHGGHRPAQLPGSISGHRVVHGNDLASQPGGFPGPVVQKAPPVADATPSGPWPQGPDTDMPKIVSLEVKCEKSVMRVFVAFDKPFFGVIFSKGHYHNVNCIHLPAGLGHTSANFDIGIDSCGTQGNTENGLYGYGVQSGSGSFFENIIVIQYDPQVQEVWDQARKLRCTWHDQYEKSVTFRPFPVDMLDVVRADFAGDNVGCWMQIQVGKGPWASEVSGLVKIGQSMTMVLAIKDDDNKFDMLVRNCMAHDGVRAPVQLVDQWGCVTRPKLMSKFTKIKNFGQSASVLSYAHFQAFKFPDSMEVHFQCTIQICRYQCPEQCTQPSTETGGYSGHIGKSGLALSEREESAAKRRRRRATNANETSETNEDTTIEYSTTFRMPTEEDVGLNKVITVVSDGDLDFIAGGFGDVPLKDEVPLIEATEIPSDIVCMSTFGFTTMLVVLIGTLIIACIFSAVIVLKRPHRKY